MHKKCPFTHQSLLDGEAVVRIILRPAVERSARLLPLNYMQLARAITESSFAADAIECGSSDIQIPKDVWAMMLSAGKEIVEKLGEDGRQMLRQAYDNASAQAEDITPLELDAAYVFIAAEAARIPVDTDAGEQTGTIPFRPDVLAALAEMACEPRGGILLPEFATADGFPF
jgi:hypothetical protein